MGAKAKHQTRHLSRRVFLAATGSAAALDGFPWIRRASAADLKYQGKEIRVLTWTDVTGQAALRNIVKPFEKQTGARVIADLTGTTAQMVAKIKASAARPQYDIVMLSGVGAIELANAGLLEKPDPAQLPNLARVFPEFRIGANGYGVGYFLWTDGMIFNTAVFDAPPRSCREFWNKQHAGKLILPQPNNIAAMELTLVAATIAGGSDRNPEPGFKLLQELRSSLLTFQRNAAETAELFKAGSADVGGVISPLDFSSFIVKPEYKLSATLNLDEGFFADLQFLTMPKGHPGDNAVAHAFINCALDPKVQAVMAEEVWYGPINQDAQLSAKARAIPYIATPDMIKSKGRQIDQDYLASVRSEWIRRYTEVLTS
jgi:putative spermidine/putrescine transport system substrate-binding protein